MIHYLRKQRDNQCMEHRMPGVVLVVLYLPPLIQIIPVKGAREISVEIHHHPDKDCTKAQHRPKNQTPPFFLRIRTGAGLR